MNKHNKTFLKGGRKLVLSYSHHNVTTLGASGSFLFYCVSHRRTTTTTDRLGTSSWVILLAPLRRFVTCDTWTKGRKKKNIKSFFFPPFIFFFKIPLWFKPTPWTTRENYTFCYTRGRKKGKKVDISILKLTFTVESNPLWRVPIIRPDEESLFFFFFCWENMAEFQCRFLLTEPSSEDEYNKRWFIAPFFFPLHNTHEKKLCSGSIELKGTFYLRVTTVIEMEVVGTYHNRSPLKDI